MARRDARAYPQAGAVRGHQGARRPDGLLPEYPPGGGSFARGRRWLVPYSPLRGCAELAATAGGVRRRGGARLPPEGGVPAAVAAVPGGLGNAEGRMKNGEAAVAP